MKSSDDFIINQGSLFSYKVFSKNSPIASIKEYQFHFGQNIWRQIKKKGLIPHSKNDQARRQIANILPLPLLLSQEIDTAFCYIIEEVSEVNPRYLKLTDYTLRTYISNAISLPCFLKCF